MTLLQSISKFGAKQAVSGTASTQVKEEENGNGFFLMPKNTVLERWLDHLVSFAGSRIVFGLCNIGIIVWCFMAIPTHASVSWQAMISDIQALLSYTYDSILMRQELNSYEFNLHVAVLLKSRAMSVCRMMKKYPVDLMSKISIQQKFEFDNTSVELPKENWLDYVSTVFSKWIGSVASLSLYWIGIFVWLGFGHYCGWSNQWQLYINSATSSLMIFQFTFLANIRQRHKVYMERCMASLFEADALLERKLRYLTGDIAANEQVTIPPPKSTKIARVVDYYAALIGTLAGIIILVVFIIIWIAIGPMMQWSSNWFLISGTYAGLLGMNDGFVFINSYYRDSSYENEQFEEIRLNDLDVFNVLAIEPPKELVQSQSIDFRVSVIIGRALAKDYIALSGALIIVGLVVASSVMGWSITGQLVSNVPPSLIETFFMMALITAHNISDAQRRVDIYNMLARRMVLAAYVDAMLEQV